MRSVSRCWYYNSPTEKTFRRTLNEGVNVVEEHEVDLAEKQRLMKKKTDK